MRVHGLRSSWLLLPAVLVVVSPVLALDPGAVVQRVVEAEEMARTGPMQVLPDPAASGGSYAIVPNGAGSGGDLSRVVHLPAAGRYRLHGRVLAPSGGDNSFWVEFAGQRYEWHTAVSTDWRWARVTHQVSPGVHEPVVVTIAAPGDYALRIVEREDGTGLDQVVVTNDANLQPAGVFGDTLLWEAEEATALGAPFSVGTSPLASKASFVSAPDGSSGWGWVEYAFDVSQGGDYDLHARVLAPDPDHDSFLVRIDGGPAIPWDLPERQGWRFVRHPDGPFSLSPGPHVLRLEQGEAGTAVDLLLLSADPTVEPQRAAYARRLRPLARQHLDSPFPNPPSATPIGILHYAIPALWLDEETDTANSYLEAFQQDGSSLLMVTAVLAHAMFVGDNAPFAGRISAPAAGHLTSELWEYTEATSTVYNANRPPEEVLGSENLHVTQLVVDFLAAQALRDDPLYSSRLLRDGQTPAEHHQAWRAYLPGYLDWRARKGLFVEIASPTYAKYTTMALLLLERFAGEEAIQAKARGLVDLLLADWAQDQTARVRGGGKSRSYLGVSSFHADRDAFNGLGNWLFGGAATPRGHLSPYLLGTGYLPPLLIDGLANRTAAPPFMLASRRPGPGTRTTWTDPWTGLDYLVYRLDSARSVLRGGYVAPEVLLGSVTFDTRIPQSAISGQNRWHGAVFATEADARLFVEVEPVAGQTNVYDAHVVAQSGRALVAQKTRNGSANNGRSRVYVASCLDTLEESSGWIFVEEGDAFAGVRVVDGGYAWADPATKNRNADPALNYITLEREYSPIVLEVGRRSDHATLAAFRAAVLARPFSWDGALLLYGGPDGTIEYSTLNDTVLPRVDGQEPPFDRREAFTGGFHDAMFDSPRHVVRFAGGALTLDTDAAACGPSALAEVGDLRLDGAQDTVLSWSPVTGAVSYDVTRGLLSGLPHGDFGTCRSAFDPDPGDLSFADSDAPPPGEGFAFLVRARHDLCRALGPDRPNRNPDRCP